MQTDPQTTKSSNPKDVLAANEQRVLLHLIPSPALAHAAAALMDGARKYGPYNWREEGVSAVTYISATMRHLRDWLDGEEDAEDSKVHHLGHAMACLAILLDAIEIGNLVDDRPLPAPTSEIFERMKANDPDWTAAMRQPWEAIAEEEMEVDRVMLDQIYGDAADIVIQRKKGAVYDMRPGAPDYPSEGGCATPAPLDPEEDSER